MADVRQFEIEIQRDWVLITYDIPAKMDATRNACMFRKWFDDAKKISEHNHFVLKENMLAAETSFDAICAKYFCSDISESHSKPESQSKSETQPEDSGIQQSPIIPSRTASYTELATLGKNVPSGPIPLEQKEAKKPFKDEDIDEMFPPDPLHLTTQESIVLLRSKWTKGTSIEFVDLIHQIRPDLTRKEAGTLFAKLIEQGKMTYDPDGWLVWVEPSGPKTSVTTRQERVKGD